MEATMFWIPDEDGESAGYGPASARVTTGRFSGEGFDCATVVVSIFGRPVWSHSFIAPAATAKALAEREYPKLVAAALLDATERAERAEAALAAADALAAAAEDLAEDTTVARYRGAAVDAVSAYRIARAEVKP